jgi:hypothetical protein
MVAIVIHDDLAFTVLNGFDEFTLEFRLLRNSMQQACWVTYLSYFFLLAVPKPEDAFREKTLKHGPNCTHNQKSGRGFRWQMILYCMTWLTSVPVPVPGNYR